MAGMIWPSILPKRLDPVDDIAIGAVVEAWPPIELQG